jgi:hypothetical protein
MVSEKNVTAEDADAPSSPSSPSFRFPGGPRVLCVPSLALFFASHAPGDPSHAL